LIEFRRRISRSYFSVFPCIAMGTLPPFCRRFSASLSNYCRLTRVCRPSLLVKNGLRPFLPTRTSGNHRSPWYVFRLRVFSLHTGELAIPGWFDLLPGLVETRSPHMVGQPSLFFSSQLLHYRADQVHFSDQVTGTKVGEQL